MRVHALLHPERLTTVTHFSKWLAIELSKLKTFYISMVFSNFTAITTLRAYLFNHHLSSSRRLSFGVGSFHICLDLMLRSRLILAPELGLHTKRTPAHLDRIGVASAQMFS